MSEIPEGFADWHVRSGKREKEYLKGRIEVVQSISFTPREVDDRMESKTDYFIVIERGSK